MRSWKSHIAIIGLLFTGTVTLSPALAQDIRFSQYQATPTYINPAMAGTIRHPVIQVNSRFQQFGAVAYRTGFASLALPFYLSDQEDVMTGGVAVNFLQDVAGQSGEYRTTSAQVAAAYNLYLNRYGTHFISLGLQTGYRQTQVDFTVLQWPSQLRYNGFTGSDLSSTAFANRLGVFGIHTGVVWMYDPTRNPLAEATPMRLFAGLSVSYLNEPSFQWGADSDNALTRGYLAQAGGQFTLSSRLLLSPDVLAVWQDQLFSYQVGTLFTYHTQYSTASNPIPADLRLLAGTWYREEASLVFLLGLGGKKWQAAVSYDANASIRRRGVSNQYAMEVSLQYQWFTKKSPKTQSTPLF